MDEKKLEQKLLDKILLMDKENVDYYLNNDLKELYYKMKDQIKDYDNKLLIQTINKLDEQLDEPFKYIQKK
jgi:hypothetical protein